MCVSLDWGLLEEETGSRIVARTTPGDLFFRSLVEVTRSAALSQSLSVSVSPSSRPSHG